MFGELIPLDPLNHLATNPPPPQADSKHGAKNCNRKMRWIKIRIAPFVPHPPATPQIPIRRPWGPTVHT